MLGFGVNYMANLVVLPMFGMHVSLKDNFVMGLVYTAISVARSYAVRRVFSTALCARWSSGG